MLDILIETPSSVMDELRSKFKDKRLYFKFTQKNLASRSGMSLGSLKRFESSGQISLESLLKLSVVLECLDDFKQLALPNKHAVDNMDDLLREVQ